MNDEERAAMREGLLEAAGLGMKNGGKPRRNNRNPLYQKPTPAGAAWSRLYGTSRELAEWATADNIALAFAGRHERIDCQERNVAAVLRCADAMAAIAAKIRSEGEE